VSDAGGGRGDGERLSAVHVRLNGVFCELFDLLWELDSDEALRANAMTDAVAWLVYDLGVAPRTARAWVRATRVMAEVPVLEEAFRLGAVSLDQVLILARFVTSENVVALVGLCGEVPVGELAAAVRDLLAVPVAVKPEREEPVLHMWWDETALVLRGAIPGADGVLVESALQRLATKAPLGESDGLYREAHIRDAEALIQMASESLAEDRDHDRATLVVHVPLEALDDPEVSVSVAGRLVDRDELLRLACDARLQPAIDDPDGVTIGIGRVSRQIPAWLGRALDGRDGGCRFPSCHRTRWTHGHHIAHWANGGPTNLDNLITLCGWHHRLIHKDHWQIQGNPNGKVTFINKFGTPHQPVRPKFPPYHHDLLMEGIERVANHHLQRLEAVG